MTSLRELVQREAASISPPGHREVRAAFGPMAKHEPSCLLDTHPRYPSGSSPGTFSSPRSAKSARAYKTFEDHRQERGSSIFRPSMVQPGLGLRIPQTAGRHIPCFTLFKSLRNSQASPQRKIIEGWTPAALWAGPRASLTKLDKLGPLRPLPSSLSVASWIIFLIPEAAQVCTCRYTCSSESWARCCLGARTLHCWSIGARPFK